jgi:hypothetical protein
MISRLYAMFCLVSKVTAFTISLSEQHRPYPIIAPDLELLQWNRGSTLLRLASGDGLRIVDNRIVSLQHNVFLQKGLSKVACAPKLNVLCEVRGGEAFTALGIGSGSRILPTQDPVLLHSGVTPVCSDGSGRVVQNDFPERYDVSVCDIYDAVVDVVYRNGAVFFAPIQYNSYLYTVLGFLVVIAVVVITQNIAVDLFKNKKDTPPVDVKWCLLLGLCIVFCSCVMPGLLHIPLNCDTFFWSCMTMFRITSTLDEFYLLVLFLYIIMQSFVILLLYSFKLVNGLHTVNFLVSCVLTAVVSVHGTIETPVTSALVFVLMFRTVFKILTLQIDRTEKETLYVREPFLITWDFAVIVFTIWLGMFTNSVDYVQGVTYACMLALAALALACECVHENSDSL